MTSKIVWSWELPEKIEGIAIVCDTWGATTNIATILANGVDKLFIANADNVKKAKETYTDALVIGESKILPKEFFHSSNYTYHVAATDVTGRVVLFMSNNGSRVVEEVMQRQPKEILTVSFSNLEAVANYVKSLKQDIFLIPSGDNNKPDPKVLEDLLCIESLDKIIHGEDIHLAETKQFARSYIERIYGNEKFDKKLNLDVVFNTTTQVVPSCVYEDELIRVRNVAK